MQARDLTLNELRDAADLAAVIAGAVEAGIFRGLLPGAATPEVLARRLGLHPRGVRIVLPVLAEVGLVGERDDGAFDLTPEGRDLLADPESPRNVAGGLRLWLENLRARTKLPEALRTGEPVQPSARSRSPEALARFMAGMASRSAEQVRRTVDLCLDRAPAARTVLDLGGGPGLYAREFIRRGLRATLYDTPETIEYVAEAYGLAGMPGLCLAPGDFLTDPLPAGPFDLALISNVLHIYGPEENRRVLEKVRDALAPGGIIAIGEMVRGRSPRAAGFAVVMLLRTERGDTYTEAEYAGWLHHAGFTDPRVDDIDPERQLITARNEPLRI